MLAQPSAWGPRGMSPLNSRFQPLPMPPWRKATRWQDAAAFRWKNSASTGWHWRGGGLRSGLFDIALQREGLTAEIVLETDPLASVLEFARIGAGVTLASRFAVPADADRAWLSSRLTMQSSIRGKARSRPCRAVENRH